MLMDPTREQRRGSPAPTGDRNLTGRRGRVPILTGRPSGLLVLSAILAVLFATLALLVDARVLHGFDVAIARLVQATPSCQLLVASETVSPLFSVEACVLLAAAASAVLWRRGYRRGALVPWIIFLSGGLELLFKLAIHQPDPSSAAVGGPGWGCTLAPYPMPISVDTGLSFPSGYTLRAVFFLVLLAAAAWRAFRPAVAATVALAVVAFFGFLAWSRVYLAWHWPTDIMGGTLLGVAFALVALHLLRRERIDGASGMRPEPRKGSRGGGLRRHGR